MPPLGCDTQMRGSCWTRGNSQVQVWRVVVKNSASTIGIKVSEKTFSSTNMISDDAHAETGTVTLQRWLRIQKSGSAAFDVASLPSLSALQRAVIAVIPVRIRIVSSA